MKELFEEIKAILLEHRHSNSSSILARALASACNSSYGISMLECSTSLDKENKNLVLRLADVTAFPDYSNTLQDETLSWLRSNEFI
jgi:hypothetical protein